MNATHFIMLGQECRGPRIEARFVTLSMKRPLILMFGFDTPNQTTMQCMNTKCNAKHAINAMQHEQCNLKYKQHGNAISM